MGKEQCPSPLEKRRGSAAKELSRLVRYAPKKQPTGASICGEAAPSKVILSQLLKSAPAFFAGSTLICNAVIAPDSPDRFQSVTVFPAPTLRVAASSCLRRLGSGLLPKPCTSTAFSKAGIMRRAVSEVHESRPGSSVYN